MLWEHPFNGTYALSEWLLSAIFWLVICVAAAAVVVTALRKRRHRP